MSDRHLLKLVRVAQTCLPFERQRDISYWSLVAAKIEAPLEAALKAGASSCEGVRFAEPDATLEPVDQSSPAVELAAASTGVAGVAGADALETWAEPEIEAGIERLIALRFGVQCRPASACAPGVAGPSIHACEVLGEPDLTQGNALDLSRVEQAVLKALESPSIERAIMRMVQRALAGAMSGAAAALLDAR